MRASDRNKLGVAIVAMAGAAVLFVQHFRGATEPAAPNPQTLLEQPEPHEVHELLQLAGYTICDG